MIATPKPTSAPILPYIRQADSAGFEVYHGRLYRHGLDLASLIEHPLSYSGHIEMPDTPVYVRHLPSLRANYEQLHHWFEAAKTRTGFPADLTVAFASKANPSEPVVRTLLRAGAAYEASTSFDVDLARHAAASGWLDRDRTIFANGFKIPAYTRNLIKMRASGFSRLTPIFDDLDEIDAFADSGMLFDVGVRSRTESNSLNRFGMQADDLERAVRQILATPNLRLTIFHAMQTVPASRGLLYQAPLIHSLRLYAQMRRIAPTLHRFSLGGGLPGRSSDMDFQDWMIQVLQNVMAVCQEEDVPTPDLIIESGRYLTQDHAAKLFRVMKTKKGDDGIPYYMIDGSIMSSFPDAWALGDSFTVLPVNHWEGPFGPARLAGLTCDPDDVYPTRKMPDIPLELPVDADGLIVGFFDCGAYQETLGGRHGTKHCLLPEGPELILDDEADGTLSCTYEPGQTPIQVLGNLGYCVPS